MAATRSPRKENLKDDLSIIWEVLKSISFFLGLYLFFLGWLHLYSYFSKFDISFTTVSVSIPSYYNYGFIALLHKNLLLVFCIFFLILFLIYYNRNKMRYAYVFLFTGILSFFIISFYITQQNARATATNIMNRKWGTNSGEGKEEREHPF